MITALAVLLAVVAKLPSARTATWLAIPALLFVVIGLIALMVSLLNISKIVNRRQTSKADAIVVGFGLGLLVAFGGPPLYAVLGLGQVAEARNGAQGVAGSLIASALFFAFGPQRSEPD